MRFSADARLGPYQLLGLLGAGGMGEVYKARDTRLDRLVAIKILPEQFAADPGREERFQREARAVAALNHAHICALHDVGEALSPDSSGTSLQPSGLRSPTEQASFGQARQSAEGATAAALSPQPSALSPQP